MIEHQQKIINFKSDVLSLCVSSAKELTSFGVYFSFLAQYLKQHFDIEKCCFLSYEDQSLKPLDMEGITERHCNGIPWALFESYFYQQNIVGIPSFISEEDEFKQYTHMMLLRVGQNRPSGVIFFRSTEVWRVFEQSELTEDFVFYLAETCQFILEMLEVRLNELQYRKLYNMTDLFHSTMDIGLILENVLVTIEENFPDFEVELVLSNDQDRQTRVRIKSFDYLSERPSTIEAFVSGEITTEHAVDLKCRLLNAPIKGRQAIYGVLQVSAPPSYIFSATQKDFIQMLAHASGNALENAQLYHQSHRLISDLQLINETSHRLNMKLDINEMLLYLQKQLMKSFQPMELCFVFKGGDYYEMTEACTQLFKMTESRIYIDHVKKHFEHTQDPLFIADFSRLIAEEVEFKSIMAIPMLVEERINGFSIVLHRDPYFFSFDSFKLMQSLIHHSSLAISNSILRNQLQEMVDRDHLTKLFARSYLDQTVENSLTQDKSGMFLLIDIDNFKEVNDTYGHLVGDEVLMQIGVKLRETIGTRGICARWGGEELAIYIPNVYKGEALKIANELVGIVPQSTTPSVTISAGLVTWGKSSRPEFQKILLHADTALYNAKRNGKNQVCLFDETLELQL